jgi:hypothetical protein
VERAKISELVKENQSAIKFIEETKLRETIT